MQKNTKHNFKTQRTVSVFDKFNFIKENRKYIMKTADTLILSNPSILTSKWELLQCMGSENIQTVSIKILQLSIKVEKITSYCYDNQQEDL